MSDELMSTRDAAKDADMSQPYIREQVKIPENQIKYKTDSVGRIWIDKASFKRWLNRDRKPRGRRPKAAQK